MGALESKPLSPRRALADAQTTARADYSGTNQTSGKRPAMLAKVFDAYQNLAAHDRAHDKQHRTQRTVGHTRERLDGLLFLARHQDDLTAPTQAILAQVYKTEIQALVGLKAASPADQAAEAKGKITKETGVPVSPYLAFPFKEPESVAARHALETARAAPDLAPVKAVAYEQTLALQAHQTMLTPSALKGEIAGWTKRLDLLANESWSTTADKELKIQLQQAGQDMLKPAVRFKHSHRGRHHHTQLFKTPSRRRPARRRQNWASVRKKLQMLSA